MKKRISALPDEVVELSELCLKNGRIDPALYTKYDVNAASVTCRARES